MSFCFTSSSHLYLFFSDSTSDSTCHVFMWQLLFPFPLSLLPILLKFYYAWSQLTGADNPRTGFQGPCLQSHPVPIVPEMVTDPSPVSSLVQVPTEVRAQLLVGALTTASSCASVFWRRGYCLSSGSLILEDFTTVFHTLWIPFTALLWEPGVSPGSSSGLTHPMTWNFSKSLNCVSSSLKLDGWIF